MAVAKQKIGSQTRWQGKREEEKAAQGKNGRGDGAQRRGEETTSKEKGKDLQATRKKEATWGKEATWEKGATWGKEATRGKEGKGNREW